MPRGISQVEGEPASDVVVSVREDYAVPQAKGSWIGRLRYVVVPIVAVVAIAGTIYLLEDKPGASEPGEGAGQTGGAAIGSARPVQVSASSEELDRTPAPRIDYPAPDFTLNNLDAKPTRLSDYRGQAVFLNFFATWCPPCRAEMPDILATYEEQKTNGAVVLAVNLQEDSSTVRNYASAVGLTFPIVLDRTGRISALYRITALPTSFFVDKDGVIRDMQIGAMSKSLMQSRLQKATQR